MSKIPPLPTEDCPTCKSELGKWTDDPILTINGLSGESYKGTLAPNLTHIQELRDYYNDLETKLGIATTNWSNELTGIYILKHNDIEELRLSIEGILIAHESDLSTYFSKAGRSNTDWTDIDRTQGNTPLITNPMNMRAIHIEELRIGSYLEDELPDPGESVRTLWWENFNGSYSYNGNFSVIAPYGYYIDPNFENGLFYGFHNWSSLGLIPGTGYNVITGRGLGSGSSNYKYTQNSILFNTSGGEKVKVYLNSLRTTGGSSTMFPGASKILINGLSFQGSNAQSVIKITMGIDVYKMFSEWSGSFDHTTYVPLWFYSQNGTVKRHSGGGGRYWFVDTNGTLTYESDIIRLPYTKIWRPVEDIHMGIVEAMQLWTTEIPDVTLPIAKANYSPPDGLKIGDEYIHNLNLINIFIDNLTYSFSGTSDLNFSIGEIKFYVVE